MRTILRAILAVVLLLGGLGGDWALAGSRAALPAHDCCCGPVPAGVEDPCPCPKPDTNRSPRSACTERQVVVTQGALRRADQGQRRTEPRPEPATWARAAAEPAEARVLSAPRGRDPDLGRHLSRLSTFRI